MTDERTSPADAAEEVFRLEGELDALKSKIAVETDIRYDDLYQYINLAGQIAARNSEKIVEEQRALGFARDAVYADDLVRALRLYDLEVLEDQLEGREFAKVRAVLSAEVRGIADEVSTDEKYTGRQAIIRYADRIMNLENTRTLCPESDDERSKILEYALKDDEEKSPATQTE